MKSLTLNEGIWRSLKANAARPALDVDGQIYTYKQIAEEAGLISDIINAVDKPFGPYVGLFCYRSKSAYIGILSILLSARAYMPLNPRFPTQRLVRMLTLSSCRLVVLGEECAKAFSDLGKDVQNLTVICPEPGEDCRRLPASMSQHKFIFADEYSPSTKEPLRQVSPEDPAYLLFTSGSTGVPKGVSVTHGNVYSYLEYTIKRYGVSSDDRVSQMFDLTFDLSAHDVFVSFLSGACLCVVPEVATMAPAKFIKDKKLTIWFSVPSVCMFLERMRMLKQGFFPTLRYSLFCGEALPQKSVELWQVAAPNSIIENLYGPTEATIVITNYRWDPKTSQSSCVNGIVPIGWPFEGHQVRVINGNNQQAAVGEEGELCLTGPQIAPGYLDAPVKTAEQFVTFDNEPDTIWYKTGDLVKQGENGCLYYLGRLDDQIQIRGYRVELQEIDKVLREVSGIDLAVSVPKAEKEACIESVSAFIQGEENDSLRKEIIKGCKRLLPEYMVPSGVSFIKKMPLSLNGKIDRKRLIKE